MKLSKRIKYLASLVDKGQNVIDIGCDHALLDIYLTLNNNNSCIAADVNENALNIAKQNIKKYQLDIKTVLSNGFDEIDIKKNTTAVIAGMGTATILEILNNKKSDKIGTFIIQTNNDYYKLRKYMINKGYYIDDELGFIDKNISYIIIKFKKGYKKYNKNQLLIGPVLMKKQDEETKLYFKYLYNEYNDILNKIPKKYIGKRLSLKNLNNKIKKLIN